MRKLLLGLLVIIVVAVLGLPYGMGMMAEKKIYEIVDNATRSTPNMDFRVESFQRGWLESTALVDVTISPPAKRHRRSKLKEFSFMIHEHIKHGPILWGEGGGVKFGQAYVRSKLQFKPDVQKQIDLLFAGQAKKPTVKSTMLITLTGATVTSLDVPRFTYVPQNKKGILTWKGLNAVWKFSSNMKQMDGSIDFSGFEAKSDEFNAIVSSIGMKYDMNESPEGLWVGTASFSFPSMSIDAKGKQLFMLSGMSMSSNSDITDHLMTSSLKMDLDKVVVDGVTYGPGKYYSTLRNLDAEILGKITKQLQKANNSDLTSKQKQMMLMSLFPELPKLLNKGPVFDLHTLTFKMPEGLISANGNVTVAKKVDETPANMLTMINRVSAALNVQVPAKLVNKVMTEMVQKRLRRKQSMHAVIAKQLQKKQKAEGEKVAAENKPAFIPMSNTEILAKAKQEAQKKIGTWISQGVIIHVGENYKFAAAFKQGKLTVNGKSINPAAMGKKPRMRRNRR